MKPIYNIHAGEYLVGSHIEAKYKDLNVWLPTKDTGIDLLVTDKRNKKAVSLQVKFSKDFNATDDANVKELKFRGWWTLKHSKIQDSKADFWIFVLYGFERKEPEPEFVVIEPRVLLNRLRSIHGRKSLYHVYFVITKSGKCWEARGMKKRDILLMAQNESSNSKRDFTSNLKDWEIVRARVR